MKFFVKSVWCLLILWSLFAVDVFACTTFCLKGGGEVLFGKNYDWMIGDGLIFVNRRGVAKTATRGGSNSARWTSRYGSVTFNQYGRENPSGGMNEAGLVVEIMWLDDSTYPAADTRPTVDTLEWVQYQLDNFASVDEVVKANENVRISSLVKLHYLVNDKNGNSASIEFLNGKLVAHTGDKMPVSALANDTYEKSWTYAKSVEPFGGARKLPPSSSSLDRFTRAALKVREFEKEAAKKPVEYAFAVLDDVAQKGYTQWSIVYDQKAAKIYFRTLASREIKSIDTKAFDYSCGGAVKILDVNTNKGGDVTRSFTDYTPKANRDLIERSFNGTEFLRQVPAAARDDFAGYAESFTCAGGTAVKKPSRETQAQLQPLFVIFPLYYVFVKAQSLFEGN
ncbi:MAG TPA: linear amide C-N hydrolase [Pyrinomonadaceae bacterium]|jgi:choloylglycine hydrolase